MVQLDEEAVKNDVGGQSPVFHDIRSNGRTSDISLLNYFQKPRLGRTCVIDKIVTHDDWSEDLIWFLKPSLQTLAENIGLESGRLEKLEFRVTEVEKLYCHQKQLLLERTTIIKEHIEQTVAPSELLNKHVSQKNYLQTGFVDRKDKEDGVSSWKYYWTTIVNGIDGSCKICPKGHLCNVTFFLALTGHSKNFACASENFKGDLKLCRILGSGYQNSEIHEICLPGHIGSRILSGQLILPTHDQPSTQELQSLKNRSEIEKQNKERDQENKVVKQGNCQINSTGFYKWMYGFFLMSLFITGSGVNAQLQKRDVILELDVRPAGPIQVDQDIELLCPIIDPDGTNRWEGGPYGGIITTGATIFQNYEGKIKLNQTDGYYNLIIEKAPWSFINCSYTCHNGFNKGTTKDLREYGYEIQPNNKTVRLSYQHCMPNCVNETIEFKEVYPLPNCTVYMNDVEIGKPQIAIMLHSYFFNAIMWFPLDFGTQKCRLCSPKFRCKVGSAEQVYSFPTEKNDSGNSEKTPVAVILIPIVIVILLVTVSMVMCYKRRKNLKKYANRFHFCLEGKKETISRNQ